MILAQTATNAYLWKHQKCAALAVANDKERQKDRQDQSAEIEPHLNR